MTNPRLLFESTSHLPQVAYYILDSGLLLRPDSCIPAAVPQAVLVLPYTSSEIQSLFRFFGKWLVNPNPCAIAMHRALPINNPT